MIEESRCSQRKCIHYIGVDQPDGTEDSERHVCAAFPQGIPAYIAFGDDLHLEPIAGDNDIQYERDYNAPLVD